MLKKMPSFYAVVNVILFLLIIAGFSSRAALHPQRMPPGRLTLYIHATTMFIWTALIVVQSALINTRRYKLHMRLGWFGVGLAVVIVVSGVTMIVERNIRQFSWIEVVTNSMNMLTFTILFALAVWWRKNGGYHKRLMVFATIALMIPALARVSEAFIDEPFLATPMLLGLIALLPVYDWITQRKITRASYIGIAVNLSTMVAQIATGFISGEFV
ncbi:MAG: hypothetical protein AAF902_15805 [Chloroflexota bacterium]